VIALDTHIWIWFHIGDPRLPEEVAKAIRQDTVLSAISVWEVMMLFERGRLASQFSPDETVRRWLEVAPLRVVPVDIEIAVLARTLRFQHDDPADRFIAATAYRAKVPLATNDAKLRSLSWLSIYG